MLDLAIICVYAVMALQPARKARRSHSVANGKIRWNNRKKDCFDNAMEVLGGLEGTSDDGSSSEALGNKVHQVSSFHARTLLNYLQGNLI